MSTFTADHLMRQAASTADYYLKEAISRLDQIGGVGYAKKNPELLAAFMITCATDYNTMVMDTRASELIARVGEISTTINERSDR